MMSTFNRIVVLCCTWVYRELVMLDNKLKTQVKNKARKNMHFYSVLPLPNYLFVLTKKIREMLGQWKDCEAARGQCS